MLGLHLILAKFHIRDEKLLLSDGKVVSKKSMKLYISILDLKRHDLGRNKNNLV